jgi:inorganic pyrophosphatase
MRTCEKLKDLPKKWIDEVQIFFANYHNLEENKSTSEVSRCSDCACTPEKGA